MTKNNETHKFAVELRALMKKHKFTQFALAKKLMVRQSQVSNWLNGKSLPNYVGNFAT